MYLHENLHRPPMGRIERHFIRSQNHHYCQKSFGYFMLLWCVRTVYSADPPPLGRKKKGRNISELSSFSDVSPPYLFYFSRPRRALCKCVQPSFFVFEGIVIARWENHTKLVSDTIEEKNRRGDHLQERYMCSICSIPFCHAELTISFPA